MNLHFECQQIRQNWGRQESNLRYSLRKAGVLRPLGLPTGLRPHKKNRNGKKALRSSGRCGQNKFLILSSQSQLPLILYASEGVLSRKFWDSWLSLVIGSLHEKTPDVFCYLGDDGVSASLNSVQLSGNPIIYSRNRGFTVPVFPFLTQSG